MLAALFMIGAAITSCSKSDDTPTPEPQPVGPTTYTMTIKATKAADAKTRALSLNGSTLNATWATGEKVYVYNKTKSTDLGGYLEAQGNGASTTLMGTLTGTINTDDELTLKFCSPSYATQDGTLEYIATNCDYATAPVTVANVTSGKITTTGDASFTNQQAIVKFTLNDAWGNPINAKSLKISAEGLKTSGTTTGDITITPASSRNVYYAALSGISSTAVTLTAIVGNTETSTHIYQKANVTFDNGQYYSINVSYQAPLTFECCDNSGSDIAVINPGGIQYRINNGKWLTYSSTISTSIPLTNGDRVCFRGSRVTQGYDMHIYSRGNSYVYGNIMSLIDSTSFATIKNLTYENTFEGLFYYEGNGQYILSHPSKKLLLPATDLASRCYTDMFKGCTNLQQAPELPASTLPSQAYCGMFYNCRNLSYVKCLATNISASQCTENWLFNAGVDVSETKNFVVDSSLSTENQTEYIAAYKGENAFWYWGDSGIPSGWTVSK